MAGKGSKTVNAGVSFSSVANSVEVIQEESGKQVMVPVMLSVCCCCARECGSRLGADRAVRAGGNVMCVGLM